MLGLPAGLVGLVLNVPVLACSPIKPWVKAGSSPKRKKVEADCVKERLKYLCTGEGRILQDLPLLFLRSPASGQGKLRTARATVGSSRGHAAASLTRQARDAQGEAVITEETPGPASPTLSQKGGMPAKPSLSRDLPGRPAPDGLSAILEVASGALRTCELRARSDLQEAEYRPWTRSVRAISSTSFWFGADPLQGRVSFRALHGKLCEKAFSERV